MGMPSCRKQHVEFLKVCSFSSRAGVFPMHCIGGLEPFQRLDACQIGAARGFAGCYPNRAGAAPRPTSKTMPQHSDSVTKWTLSAALGSLRIATNNLIIQ